MIGRIVVINDLARPQGGASLLAVQSAEAFAERGYRVTMISGDSGPERSDGGVEHVCLGQNRLLASNPAATMVRGIYNRAARLLVGEWIADNDTPDTIYHVHGWSQILSSALFAALAPVRDRLVLTAHDFFLSCPNGAMYDYAASRPCQRRPMSGACIVADCDRRNRVHKFWRLARHAVQSSLVRQGAPLPLLLIHEGMRAHLERADIDGAAMVVLPNPVTPYCHERVRAERNRDVLFVGRLEATKGVDLAAEACRRAGVRLVVVGDGALEAQLRAEYPEMMFCGRRRPEQIGELARRARMLVMPSRHMEPFGLTAVEALWSGLPVLSSSQSLIADDIERTGAGRGIDPRDIDGFAGAIAALCADDALTERMSRAAFADTRPLALTPERWLDALVNAYEAILAGGLPALRRAALDWSKPPPSDAGSICGAKTLCISM